MQGDTNHKRNCLEDENEGERTGGQAEDQEMIGKGRLLTYTCKLEVRFLQKIIIS